MREKAAGPGARWTLDRAHEWTHDGDEVLVLKCVDLDGEAYQGFKWPLTVGASVEPSSWNPEPKCGGGLHGWPWGLGIGDGKDAQWDGKWIIFGCLPGDVVGNIENERKCKARIATTRFVGSWDAALEFLRKGQMALVAASTDHSAMGDSSASSATGDRSASSATGYRSASSAMGDRSASSAMGDRSASSATGDSSASSAMGDRSASSATGGRSASSATGDSSASSATGYSSASSATGDSSASSATGYRSASSATGGRSASVCTGLDSYGMAGIYGCIALAFLNTPEGRAEMRCAETGCGDGSDGKLKSNVWYRLSDVGAFEESG